MAYLNTKHVAIKGISACVPKNCEDNIESKVFQSKDEALKFVKSTGVRYRHMVENGITTSDLCFASADKLINDLGWDRDSVDCLIFVSQTPDYILPATSCILQNKLGLSKNCFALDISLGCSGWVYGLSTICTLLDTGLMKRGLLLAGDASSLINSDTDKSARPMFGDAGTATAVEFVEDENIINFILQTDGSGANAIIIPDGGFRNVITPKSFEKHKIEDGIERSARDLAMDGMDVFGFSISKAPKAVLEILEKANKHIDEVDFFTFHQANLSMNEIIRKKLKLDAQKVPYSLYHYGNTSSASIPLALVSQVNNQLSNETCEHVVCGFGVGFSWGAAQFKTQSIVCPNVIEI